MPKNTTKRRRACEGARRACASRRIDAQPSMGDGSDLCISSMERQTWPSNRLAAGCGTEGCHGRCTHEGFGDESEESEHELENMAQWPAEVCHGAADFDVLWDYLGGEQESLGGRPTQTVVEYRFEPRPAQPVWSSTVQSLAGKPMMHRLLDKEHGAYKD